MSRVVVSLSTIATVLRHGWNRRCPCCGTGAALSGYLRIRDNCSACGEALHHHRADDAPAYLTMLATGMIVVPAIWFVEAQFRPALSMHFLVWITLGTAISLILLPRFKAMVLALQWILGMHGFETQREELPTDREGRR